jgi:hypothetical protein
MQGPGVPLFCEQGTPVRLGFHEYDRGGGHFLTPYDYHYKALGVGLL